MDRKIYDRVAALTGLGATNLEQLALGELVQEVILPKICFKDPRFISEDFVNFMAEFGNEIYKQNKTHGETLFDIALQHIFLDGCFFALPPLYRKACMGMDYVYGVRPIGKAEFHFLKEQRANLLSFRERSNLLFCHAEKIIFELLEAIAPDGKLLKKGLCKDGVTSKELRFFAEETASAFLGFQRVYNQLATPENWQIWPRFFLDHQKEVNWKDLADRLNISPVFFRGRKCRRMIYDYVNKEGSV